MNKKIFVLDLMDWDKLKKYNLVEVLLASYCINQNEIIIAGGGIYYFDEHNKKVPLFKKGMNESIEELMQRLEDAEVSVKSTKK